MLTAAKPFKLVGQTYTPGQAIAPDVWAGLTNRTRLVLTRTRRVRSTEFTPVAEADTPPRGLTTPRHADGATSKRGRPRKVV